MEFLSPTMSKATEFAEWICYLHKKPCHVVCTYFRPTLLQRYVFPVGGSGLYLIVDESEQFREDNFLKLQDTITKQKQMMGGGNKSAYGQASGRIARGGSASGGSDIYKIVKLIMERKWGWGVVMNIVKKPPPPIGTMSAGLSSSRGASYIVDTLLHCSIGSSENGSRPKSGPSRPGEKGEMHVVPIQLPLISVHNKLMVRMPSDLRPLEVKQSILFAVQELEKRYPQGLQKLHPVKDMGIQEPELVELVNQIEELEKKMFKHPLHKSRDENQIRCFQRKAGLNLEIQKLKFKMRESQIQKFRDELKNRSRVLKKLGHIDADGVVQLKGRAACLVDTGDELLVTELMSNGTFNDLDHHQIATHTSCFIPGDRSTEEVQLRRLDEFLNQTKGAAHAVGEANLEKKFTDASDSLRRGIKKAVMILALVTSPTGVIAGVLASDVSHAPEPGVAPDVGELHLPDEPFWVAFLHRMSTLKLVVIIVSVIIGVLAIGGLVVYVVRKGTPQGQDQDRRVPESGPVGGQDRHDPGTAPGGFLEAGDHALQRDPPVLVYHPDGRMVLAVPGASFSIEYFDASTAGLGFFAALARRRPPVQ